MENVTVNVSVRGTEIFGVADPPLTSGTVGRKVRFTFDETWNELSKVAVFNSGNIYIDGVIDENNECEIPWEVLTHHSIGLPVQVGVRGVKGSEVIIPTIYATMGTLHKGTSLSDGQSNPRTPDLIDQLMDKVNNIGKGDWDENDPESPNYIANRTHYKAEGFVEDFVFPSVSELYAIVETTDYADTGFALLGRKLNLVPGNTYTLELAGTNYITGEEGVIDTTDLIAYSATQALPELGDEWKDVVVLISDSTGDPVIISGAKGTDFTDISNFEMVDDTMFMSSIIKNEEMLHVTFTYTLKGYNNTDVVYKTIDERYLPMGMLNEKFQIRDKSIITKKLADEAVTTDKIKDEAITSDKIRYQAVTSEKLALRSINHSHIQDNGIVGQNIQDYSIDTSHLRDRVVTDTKLAADISFGKVSAYKETNKKSYTISSPVSYVNINYVPSLKEKWILCRIYADFSKKFYFCWSQGGTTPHNPAPVTKVLIDALGQSSIEIAIHTITLPSNVRCVADCTTIYHNVDGPGQDRQQYDASMIYEIGAMDTSWCFWMLDEDGNIVRPSSNSAIEIYCR